MTFFKKWFVAVIFFLGVQILSLAYARGQLILPSNSSTSKQAPDHALKTLSGQTMTLTQFRQGQKAVIFFWATWCPHCREQLPALMQEVPTMANKGIKMILVDVGEDASQVQQYATKNQITTEIFLDEDSSLSEQYGVLGVPTFFFVNQNGVIKGMEHSLPMDYEKIVSQ